MGFQGQDVATLNQVAAATASTSLFTNTTNTYGTPIYQVNGRTLYNASTAICYVTYGTVSSTTAYTLQVAANTVYTFPVPTYSGPVTANWAAANGTAYTTQW